LEGRDMSRRNRQPKRESAIPGKVSIRVVCTDRGQHPEVRFGAIPVWPIADGWHANTKVGLRATEYVDLDPLTTDVDHALTRLPRTYPFSCRRCRRNVPLRQDTLERLLHGLAADNQHTLDISAIR
jgi:hypothetical protein